MAKTTETLEFLINANAASATKAFKDVGDAADTHLKKAQTRSEEVSANLTKFGAGAVGVAAIVGAGLVKLGSDFDNAFDKIRTQTGATGSTLKGLEGDFKSALSQVPNSMGEVSTAIATLNQKLGLSGKPLQDLSVQFLNLSTITKTDVKANVEAATGVFNQFGITADQQGGKLDELFRVTQATGIGFDTLTTAMSANGAALKGAGLTFDESAALLGLLAKNGMDASTVIPALSKAMATAAKDGKPAAELFRETFDAIKNAPNDTAAAGIALDVFGAKAGPKFAELIRAGKVGYEDFTKALAGGGDSINKAAADTFDFGEKLGILRNKLEVAIEPAVSSAFDNLTSVVTVLGDAFTALPAPVTAAAGNILLFGTAALGAVGAASLVAGSIGKLVTAAQGAGGAVATFAKFLASVGPEASIAGGALVGLGAILALNASEHALVTARTKEYVAALKSEADGTKEAVAGLIAQKITANDVADSAKRLGLSVADVAHVITGQSVPAYDALKSRVHDLLQNNEQFRPANAALIEDFHNVAGTVNDQSDAYQKAVKQSADLAEANQALGITTNGVTTAGTDAAAAITGVDGAAKAAIPTEKELADAAKKAAEGFKAQQDAALSLIDTQVGYNRSVEDVGTSLGEFQTAQTEATKAVNEHGAASDEAAKAQKSLDGSSRSLEDAVNHVAVAAAAAAKDQATMAGATFNTSDSVNAQIGALQALKVKFPELAGAIDEHIAKLNAIPHEKKTDVSVDTGDSAHNLQVIIDKMNSIHDKTVTVDAVGSVHVNGAAAGGPRSGVVLVGEEGPELVALPKGSFVYTASQTKAMQSGVKGMADGGYVGVDAAAIQQQLNMAKRDLDIATDPAVITMLSTKIDMLTAQLANLLRQQATMATQYLPAWTPPNSVNPTWGLGQEITPPPGIYAPGVHTSAPYMGPAGTGAQLLDPAVVAAINEAGNDKFGNYNRPTAPTQSWKPYGVGPNDYRAPAGTVINVYMPPGSDGEDVVRALKQYERRNGPIPVSTR